MNNFSFYLKKYHTLILVLTVIILTIIPFYPVLLLNKTLTTAGVTSGAMGNIISRNFINPTLKSIGNTLDPGGSAWQDEPLAFKVANIYHQNKLPIWNMSQGFGRPLGADMMSNSFSIFKIPFFIFPSFATLDFIILVKLCTASVGMLLFLRQQKISFMASLFGSLVFSLSGYFLYFRNMGHIQVEVLLPWLLLIIDNNFLSKRFLSLFLLAAIMILLFMGGHPESMLLSLVYSVAYAIWRYRLDLQNNFAKVSIILTSKFITALAMSLLLGAFFLIPFFEYFMRSNIGYHDIQNKIYSASLSLKSLPLQFFPLLIKYRIEFHLANHWGTITTFFILFSIFNKKKRHLTMFLLISSLILIIKIYGLISFEWLAHIPIFNNFVYSKYLQPELSFSFAALSAIGFQQFQQFLEKNNVPYKKIFFLLLAILIVFGLGLFINKEILSEISFKRKLGSYLIPMGAFIITIFIVKQLSKKITKIILPVFLFFILAISEIWIAVPGIYLSREINPYYLQPSLRFLQEKQKKQPFRVYSPDGILYPATASVFDLQDIRDLHAVYPDDYASYIKEFIYSDFKDRFSDSALNSDVRWRNNPLFNLTNAQYILAAQPISSSLPSSLMNIILAQNSNETSIKYTEFTINNLKKPTVFAHAPSKFTYSFTPSNETKNLQFYPALHPDIWKVEKSDGVIFTITIQHENSEQIIFQKTISTGKEPASWNEQNISLSKFIGKNVILSFETNSLGSNAFDWSGWSNLNLNSGLKIQEPQSQFSLIYDNEIMIYHNDQVFPRVFTVAKVFLVSSEEEALVTLKNPSLNLKNCSVVINPNNEVDLSLLASSTIEECSESKTTESQVTFFDYQDTYSKFEISLEQDEFLQLSDLFYPGWNAIVDGVPVTILQSNFAFRGIPISKGKHVVEMKYEPYSYKIGATISAVSLVFSLVFILIRRLKKNEDQKN